MTELETLIRWKKNNNIQPDEAESAYIKQIIKELSVTFPCEWDEALLEIEKQNESSN